ncbi:putative aspergillopepsin [Aspergillus coremiiformis]|uniref:Putative aspergillopepsin n=1 Tax=Aspergillus coremiiformis TaxID=138285 RepID=A0A5N6Z2Q7_9EURO|nr:putative aspergillopepsin [Aspergillus coremiiformis]
MKFAAILSSTVLASAALAAPLSEQRRARNTARLQARAAQRHSNFPLTEGTNQLLAVDENPQRQFSTNWAGAVLIGSGYTSVAGTFTVPQPAYPAGAPQHGEYCASAWVGIDGDTCRSAILQTGIDFCVDSNGPNFSAWYEWFPDFSYDFSNIEFSVGDNVRVSINAFDTSSGNATVENLTTGKTVSHTFPNQGYDAQLCETNAEWIVEDFSRGFVLVPFVDFDTVTFTDISAIDNGVKVGAAGSTIFDIRQNNVTFTSSTVTNDEITVKYIA